MGTPQQVRGKLWWEGEGVSGFRENEDQNVVVEREARSSSCAGKMNDA